MVFVIFKREKARERERERERERKPLTLEYVTTKYPEDQWTHAFTDGSAADATRDGGGGVHTRYSDGKAHIATAMGKYSTNLKAEAEAPEKSAIEIRNNVPRTKSNGVIFTTTYPEPSPMWSSSQVFSLSSTNTKIPTTRISNLPPPPPPPPPATRI